MPTKTFRGDAQDVAQVDQVTVGGTVEIGDLFIHTINGKTVQAAATTTNLSTTASNIAAALIGTTVPAEFAELGISTNTSIVILTASTPGVPFTETVNTTEGDGSPADSQTYVKSTTTANSGHWSWDVAANWNASGVPVAADDVYIGNVSDSIKYGLGQSAVTLNSLNILQEFTKDIGLPVINSDGANPYIEWRTTYLQISATTINIGQGAGQGSGRIKLDVGTVQCALNVYNSGRPAEDNLESILWKGTNASNVIEVSKGSLGVAVFPGESAAIATLRVGYISSVADDANVRCGSGTDLHLCTVEQSGGVLQTNSTINVINQTDGEHVFNSGNITTLNLKGGALRYKGSGTLTTVVIGSNGTLDFSQDLSPRTITNPLIMYKGAKLIDPHSTVTFSGGITLSGCKLSDVSIDVGVGRGVQFS